MSDDDEQLRLRFLDLSAPLLHRFRAHPSIPTELNATSLAEVLQAAAPVLLAIFGSPEAAAGVIDDSLERLFSRLDDVEQSLEQIETSILALEAKHDASVLARFKSGVRELRDGLRACRKPFRERVLLDARTKLTELCELPPGLLYGSFSSQVIAAAACLLVAMIDTWHGEIESAYRYNLRALVADPLWTESYLGSVFTDALAGGELRRLGEKREAQIEIERTRMHGFFWNKVGAGALGALAVVLNPAGSGVHLANTVKVIAKYNTQEAQQVARLSAVATVEAYWLQRRAQLLHDLSSERLRLIE